MVAYELSTPAQHPVIQLVNSDGSAYNPATDIPSGTFVKPADLNILSRNYPTLQAAIDAADARFLAGGRVHTVLVDPSDIRLTTTLLWRSCNLNAQCPGTANRVYWDGGSVPMIQRVAGSDGGLASAFMRGFNLRPGTGVPSSWLDLTAAPIDHGFRLEENQFYGCSGDGILVLGWYNLHWEHNRFSGAGGYPVRLTAVSGQNLSSAVLDHITWDNDIAGTGLSAAGPGFLLIDNSAADATNLGVVEISNGRLELNANMTGNQAVVTVKEPNTPSGVRIVGLKLRNIAYSGGRTGAEVLVYRETTNTSGSAALILDNVRAAGLSAVRGGTWPASFPTIPLTGNYGYLAVNSGADSLIGQKIAAVVNDLGSEVAYRMRRGSEANDRWSMDANGKQSAGPGSTAADTTWGRRAAGVWGTDSAVELDNLASDASAPAASKARLYARDNGSGQGQLVARFPTGSVQVLTGEATADQKAVRPDQQKFETAGSFTWTKPSGVTVVRVEVVGAGGGGGSGRKGAAGTARVGGGGGGSGSYAQQTFLASDLGATVNLVVGAGGTAGAAQTTNSTDGNAGGQGGATSFGGIGVTEIVGMQGSNGGAAGGSGAGGTGGGSTTAMTTGSTGGAASTSGGNGAAGVSGGSSGAGGAGGGISAANAAGTGGSGGSSGVRRNTTVPTGGASGVAGSPAANPTAVTDLLLENGAGGGGGADAGGGAGGLGKHGSGGGGGGAATDSLGNSGAGGVGGDGAIWVTSW